MSPVTTERYARATGEYPSRTMRLLLVTLATIALSIALAFGSPDPVTVGDLAPDFTLTDHLGREITLSEYRGKQAVLVAFYPESFTRGCTMEMKCLRKDERRLEADGVTVLAISSDEPDVQRRFATSLDLSFSMLSDPDHTVSKRYGVFVQSATGGHAGRSMFVVDREGRLVHVDRDYTVTPRLDGALDEALRKLAPKDPIAALRAAPDQPENRGKLTAIALVEAVLAADDEALDRCLHPDFGKREGESAQMQKTRRKSALDAWKRAYTDVDFGDRGVLDTVDPAQMRVFDTESATEMRLRPLEKRSRALAEQLTEGDVLVVFRPKFQLVGSRPVFPKELALIVREHDGRGTICAQSNR